MLIVLLIYAFVCVYDDYKKAGNDFSKDGIGGFVKKVWFE
jgi:hypothetical protein